MEMGHRLHDVGSANPIEPFCRVLGHFYRQNVSEAHFGRTHAIRRVRSR